MNKKLNVLFFILILTLFVHGGVYAEEENSSDNNTNVTQESSQNSPTKEKVLTKDQSTEPKDEGIASDEKQNTSEPKVFDEATNNSEVVENSDSSGNFEAVENSASIEKSEAENNSEVTENPEVTDNSEDTNNSEVVKDPELANTSDTSSEDKSPENKAESTEDQADSTSLSQKDEAEAEEAGSTEENPEKTGEEKPNPEDTEKPGEGKEAEVPSEETDPKKEDKESHKQVDPESNEDLKNLKNQIDSEKDKDKQAELQKEYNKKLFEEIEKSGAEKLDEEVLNRFKDKERKEKFYAIQEEYKTLKDKLEKGTISEEEIQAFNEKLGSFKVPRKLDSDETDAQKKLNDSVDVPGLKDGASDDAKAKLAAYEKAKKDLQDALDPEKARQTSPEDLQDLINAFEKAENDLKDGIEDGSISPTYTDGDPTIRVFPLVGGKLGDELKEDDGHENTYYIPDNTDVNLLLHINKDDDPQNFTFTVRPLEQGASIPEGSASNLAFLNGEPVELVKNKDGSYSFTVNRDKTFGIAQLRFNMPGFKGDFHKGFDLEMKLNDETVTKKFRITKKGYEDDAVVSGPGANTDEDPKNIPEVDGGKTENSTVVDDTDKIIDFFAYLKKSNTYIDDVTINSGNGESLPLSSVDITFTLPKNQDGEFAEYIHKSGLKYHNLGNGRYQLKLDTKILGGNLVEKDGKLYLADAQGNATDKELTGAELTDVILENAGKKVYVDEDGKSHDIISSEVFESEDKTLKVQDGKLYKDNKELGSFDKDGKLKKDGTTYIFKDGKLTSYTKEHDVFKGNVVNKDGKADPDVSATVEGKQVVIETKDKDNKVQKSYGGTILEDAIYDKDGKVINKKDYEGKSGDIVGKAGDIVINPNGTVANVQYDSTKVVEDENTGIKSVTVDGKTYRIVTNPVFKAGYLIDGLEYKEGLSLVDKFGKRMNVEVSKDDKGIYTFTRKLKSEDKETIKSGKSEDEKRNVTISDKKQILVNNQNEVLDNPDGKYEVVGDKYYYNGEKFVKAEGDGLKGNKFLESYESIDLDKKIKNSYKSEDGKDVEIKKFDKKDVYEGSTNPEDYFKLDGKTYLKKSQNGRDYYVNADPKASDDILSVDKIAKIVQTLGEGNKAIEKVTDETSIFDAVQNAKFGLRFPGFLAGKNIVYNLHADVKATYEEPSKTEEGKWVKKSIFTSEKDGVKKIDKFFTLKNEKVTRPPFFKNNPEELEQTPDYRFFNLFYRDLNDRDRDKLITDLLSLEKEAKDKKEAINNEKSEEKKEALKKDFEGFKDKNKNKLNLLEILQGELGRLYKGAKFVLTEDEEGNQSFEIQRDGLKVEIDRSLLWEIGFNNSEGSLFPENKDNVIVVEDHNMDNRLVYDEIIINDTEEKWNEYKKAFDDAKKVYDAAKKADDKSSTEKTKKDLAEAKEALEKVKFEGSDAYFFLDQIDNIRLGVNPSFIEGRFGDLGEDFKLTGKEIIKELGNKDKVTINRNGIDFVITRDRSKGQVRIKVLNAFYKKVKNDKDHKFESPAQKTYQEKIKNTIDELEKLNIDSTKNFKDSFDSVIKKYHSEDSECHNILKSKFDELMKAVDEKEVNGKKLTDQEKQTALENIKKKLVEELEKLPLIYLDKSKGDYMYDDMRFNAIRMELKPGITMGGAMNPQNTKKFGLTSVIVPDIDIPYTDEFGEVLTNKDMYVKAEIENILKNGIGDKKYKEADLKDEAKFREIMTEAYKRVNGKINAKKIEIKDLVEVKDESQFAWEKYSAVNGSSLNYEDLAVNGESLKNKKGGSINPWYIGEGKKPTTIKDRFKEKFGKDYAEREDYKKLEGKSIDLAAYYMSNKGYDRAKYANSANYKLDVLTQKEGLFGEESDWKKKCCYGIIGHCIQEAGKDFLPAEDADKGKFGADGQSASDFELTYTPDDPTSDEEKPGVDKKVEGDSSVDISDETEKSVDFTIDVTVDKMTKEQKSINDALNPNNEDNSEKSDEGYNDRGYYEYKNSLILDILPEIFKVKDGTKLSLEVDRKKLMANGANKDFEYDEDFNKWKEQIEYAYTDDLYAEYEKLLKSDKEIDKKRAEVLKKAIDDANIEKGDKVQAIIAWLPDFEAPHGSKNQFTFKLNKLYVDKKKFKDFDDGIIGSDYTNHGAFGDKAKFYFGKTKINIHEGPSGNVNKYLQILDKDGNIVDADKAEGWFKGSAELKFGDKFNYRIKYTHDSGIVDVPGQAKQKVEFSIEDVLPKVKDKGLRPVLRDYVTSDLDGFEVIYKIGDTEYSEEALKKAIEENKAKLSDVTSLVLESGDKGFPDGATKYFDIPMMIPELDAKIENGKVIYIGKDGKEVELGKASEFFNLKDLMNKDKDLVAENTVEGSNTVKVYLDKERFLKVFKEFFDANGEEIKKDRPEVKFDIYQIETDKDGNPLKDEKGNIKKVKLTDKNGNPLQLVANEKNSFTDKVDGLPIFKKFVSIDENDNVKVEITKYKYEIKEVNADGYDVEIEIMDKGDDELGFVFKAKNTEKPEEPEEPEEPEKPEDPEEPKNPPEEPKTPPEEPEKPEEPKTPSDEAKKETEEVVKTPNKESENKTTDLKKVTKEENGTNNIPKTGVREDLMGLFISGILLGVLVYFRRKLER
ncbi:MAG: hypothetical protein E6Z55_03340 [Peptoniphilus harei]|nr:hypothetical protein [Peptoniphilus harei]